LAGIYFHIPFCKQKCHYCNFFSLASQKLRDPFLKALKHEIASTRDYLGNESVNTIYFGGGTPSLFHPGVLQEMIEMVAPPPDPTLRGEEKCLSSITKEITLEINPDDITEDYVAQLQKTWFNRFSIGIQSFFDEDLEYLNRTHSAAQALRAVKLLQDAGYSNISIDLIYGIPSSTSARWQKNLDIAFSLGVQHISAYALTVEARTPLAWMIDRQRSAPVSEESQVAQFRMLMRKAKEEGFLQYEISNFCKPGHHAMHNTNYWKGIPYLGLGPSAHSYNGTGRRWNISNLSKYIGGMVNGECIYEEEVLTLSQKYNEYVMTSLRTMWGCAGEKIISDFGFAVYDSFRKAAIPMIGQGLLTESAGVYFLTDEGKLFADRIAADLFLT
jgi:oxygen-independent coproporphyrinogen-3 oxidase